MVSDEKKSKTVADFWDQHHKLEIPKGYWTCHPIINEYVNSIIAPDSSNILEWFAKNFAKGATFKRGLSLGCGTGAADRQAIQAGLCRFIDGIDISQSSIEAAKKEAFKAGISDRLQYSVSNLNSIKLPRGYYDFALCVGSLHHIENLEHIFNEIRTSLKPNAYVFINEYVGPSRLQWTEKQLDILNRVWEIMPLEYRKAGPIFPVNKEELSKVDPSEAVRSAEIIPLIYNTFEVVAHIEYGGSFLMPFWNQGIIPDIFLDNPNIDKQVIVKLLCVIDELVRGENILPSCYVQIVAQNSPPKSGRPVCLSRLNNNCRRWIDFWMYSPAYKKKRNFELVRKAFYVFRNEGFIPLFRAVLRYLKKFLVP